MVLLVILNKTFKRSIRYLYTNVWKKEIITQKSFQNNLILADMTFAFKKYEASLLKNYGPTDGI